MPARLLSASDDDLEIGARALREGQLVAFPTETVYGLGASAFDPAAVARVFDAKQRPHFDPLIVHVASRDDLAGVATSVSSLAAQLIEVFWPGPLTLILPKTKAVPSLVTSGLETVAVRMPSHPVAHALITKAGVPVAAPSANPFGRLSPTRALHVLEALGDDVEFIVDGGPTQFGIESTIVDVSDGETVKVLRHGAVPVEELAAVAGASRVLQLTGDGKKTPVAPGQLEHHYAPLTRLVPVTADSAHDGKKAAYLAFSSPPEEGDYAVVEVLSSAGDVKEAAANLFDALHRLDDANVDVIVFEPAPEEGVGRAINDRFRRAAATWK